MTPKVSCSAPVNASASLRLDAGDAVTTVGWDRIPATPSPTLQPWRTFRWRHGQRHYSGSYWSATQHGHVIYESRLELTRLIYADFDRSVSHIAAQPFLIQATVDQKLRRHVPDFLLSTSDGPVIVDVKPTGRLQDPKVAHVLSWTRVLVERRGWRYEIWTEPPPIELSNLRFLAGYRDVRRFNQDRIQQLIDSDLDGRSLGEAFCSQPRWPAPLVRSAVLHLLWRGHLVTDLHQLLSSKSLLHKGSHRGK